ncbi:MAG TPA: PspC domain-containing protein [Thermomicrobiales bacterium]|nr:PspC domain-containing protein [Thermomicrobiales bacterium]
MDEQRPQDIQPEWQPLEQAVAPVNTPPTPPPPGPKRLYRSSDQKLFLGVCGGLGEYFDIDPTIIRAIFVVMTLLVGTSIAVYAVLALIMPSEASLDADPRTAAQNTINEASDEVRRGIDLAVSRVKEMTGRGTQGTGHE